MDSYSEIITNQAGQAIQGASVLVKDSTGVTATIYSDNGVTEANNPLTTDADGRFTFFAESGTYDLVITATGFPSKTVRNIVLFDPSEASESAFNPAGNIVATNVQDAIEELDDEKTSVADLASNDTTKGAWLVRNSVKRVSNLTALKALVAPAVDTTIYLDGRTSAGDGGQGIFRWVSGDQSANVTADTQAGVWVPPNSDTTGASGAWKRQFQEGEIDIRWFGAAVDGSTDDATAVQAAVNWLPANGGKVIVPGQSALGSAGLAITSKTGIIIDGRGPNAGFKATAASATTVASFGVSWIRMTGSTRCGLRNLYIDNNSQSHNAVAIYNNTECFVEGCTVVNGALNASIFAGGNERNRYVNNVVKDSSAVASSRGMWIGNSGDATEEETDALIEGNLVQDVGGSGIGGQLVRGVINANHCIDSGGAGIVQAADGSLRADGVSVSNNVCKGNAFAGIQVGDSSDIADYIQNIVVSGNVCEGNESYGIHVIKARDVSITGNVCKDNNAQSGGSNVSGIGIITGKRVAISGNACFDTRSGVNRTQQNGISVIAGTLNETAEIEDVQITGNVCRNNEQNGIYVADSNGATIDTVSIIGNTCVDNATDGVRVADSSDGAIAPVTIVGNTCLGNGTNDIRVDPSNAVIESNKYSSSSGLIKTFADGDTTPSVAGRGVFRTNNTGATTITGLDDGVIGQKVTIIFPDGNTTVDFTGTSLEGNAGVDWTPGAGDHMVCVYDGSNWFCAISDNTP